MSGVTMASELNENISLMDQSDMQNESGRKKMLTKVSSFTFSPSRVAARLSITALALNSYVVLVSIYDEKTSEEKIE